MDQEFITIDTQDAVATITLARPNLLNAFNNEMAVQLHDFVRQVDAGNGVRCILLTGAGRAFSSGADLSDPKVRSAGVVKEYFNPLIEALYAASVPIVTAVNGGAVGVGCSIALAGDIVVAARSAYFLQAFINMGLVPDGGATWLIPNAIGRARASAMLLLAERIDAECAERWGLIHQVVDDGELMTAARAIARKLADGPTQSYRLIRHGIRRALDSDLTTTLAMEADHQHEAAATADHAEALAAFIAKRKPRFTGK